jgi:sulfatase maturation enzyme AslB (radical SAM superfamily)
MPVNKDSFCIGPWTELRIDSDGTYNYCHAAIKSTQTQESILQLSPTQYFRDTGTTADNTKQGILQGQSIPQCQNCYRSEKAGLISFRQRRNLQAGIFGDLDFEQSYRESNFANQSQNFSNPRFYHVSLSNLCNLGCIMCHPQHSSYLAADLNKIDLIDQSRPVLTDWTLGPAWHNFCQHLLNNPDIVSFHVMGGEPLYHKKFHELLDILIENRHTNFAFTFVSNGTIYNSAVVEKLQNFKSVQMEISIESVTESNNYIRWPSNTATILKNIELYLAHRSDQFDVVIRTVPQLLSVIDYDQLLAWCREHQVVVDSNAIYSPDYMHAGMLPDDIKQQIQQKLQSYKDRATKSTARKINLRDNYNIDQALSINADFVSQQLKQDYNSADRWKKFLDYCRALDSIRGTDMCMYVPDLASVLRQHGY